MVEAVSNRLREIRAALGLSQLEMAGKIGISLGGLRKIEQGTHVPSGETLLKYVELGFDADWILTGVRTMHRLTVEPSAAYRAPPLVDDVVFQAVTDAVLRVHKELGVKLPMKATIQEAVDRYNLICQQADDRDERLALMGWLEIRLRKDLSAAKSEPGTGKRSA
ncbi:helix-turn-helix transcriptional regulator [Chelatococcus sp.]|uniref:helix-turn-helix transcriptional regulator n=1 Tax=Chelatococcus sp. TaxID=1953771 RepID=UPI001EC54038|nr:helix-turn-helix transcriptional regulator [Chelatococcus sp.]MBX3545551.1 helix-turn-helix transcriptional regulator [Chelatococcus sp.]